MAQTKSLENQPEDHTFWFRRITPFQWKRLVMCRRQGHAIPEARPGVVGLVDALLDKEKKAGPSGLARSAKAMARVSSLEVFNTKLNLLLEWAYPSDARWIRAPVVLDPEGLGVVVWLQDPGFEVQDMLEIYFLIGPGLPWQIHGYAQVVRMRKDGSSNRSRVECQFETAQGLPLAERNSPQKVLPRRPVTPVGRKAAPEREEVLELPPPQGTVSAQVRKEAPPPELPRLDLPTLQEDGGEDKYDKMLRQGMRLAQASIKATPEQIEANLKARPREDARQDFRINDKIPFLWCHVSEEAFKEAMVHFHQDKTFGMRSRIRTQQQILQSLAEIQDELRRKRSKARKHVDWHRNRLSWHFLRAASENEEDYFQGLTELFVAIGRDLVLQSADVVPHSSQVLAYLRNRMELQQTRDQSNPVLDVRAIEASVKGLEEIDRQMPKLMEKIQDREPKLAVKLKMYQEAIVAMNLKDLDRPVGQSPDGKDLYTVNLSATGLAFRTRRLWVKRGDMLEMRVFLSTGGKRFDPMNVYGRVVFVQGPVDGKLKVATHIDPQPAEFEQKIHQHIARKQREILHSRAALKDEEQEW